MNKYQLHKKWIRQDLFFVRQVFREFFEKKRIFLFDTADHDNLGDHAISIAIIDFLKNHLPEYKVIEIPGGNILRHTKLYKMFIRNSDIVAIPGGGFLGDLWPYEEKIVQTVMSTFSDNKVVIFPQTFYAEDPIEFSAKHKEFVDNKNLLLCLRDRESIERSTSIFPSLKARILYLPDMVCGLQYKGTNGTIREGVGLCIRQDKESVINKDVIDAVKSSLTLKNISLFQLTTMAPHFVNYKNRDVEVENKLKEFASKKLIITDRLHAMLFSAITCTPCIAFDNKSRKVSGVYSWLIDLPYIHFVDDVSKFLTFIESLDYDSNYEYPYERFEKEWMQLAKAIRNM